MVIPSIVILNFLVLHKSKPLVIGAFLEVSLPCFYTLFKGQLPISGRNN
nr:MAG TPA: hypothetical protein [Caudoviricetes sp.]